MEPQELNLKIYQGQTVPITFTVAEGEEFDFGYYDLVRMQIRKTPSSEVVWDSETSENGGLTVSDDGKTLILSLTAEETAEFNFGAAGYDIELVKNGATEVVDKFCFGRITLVKEYTKPVELP